MFQKPKKGDEEERGAKKKPKKDKAPRKKKEVKVRIGGGNTRDGKIDGDGAGFAFHGVPLCTRNTKFNSLKELSISKIFEKLMSGSCRF